MEGVVVMARTGRPKVEKVAVPCAGCGTVLLRYPSDMARHSTGRVLCATCRRKGVAGGKPRRGKDRSCERQGCGETFYVGPSSKRRFCSPECHALTSRIERLIFTCEHCGVEFGVVPGMARYNGNRFCSWAHYIAARRAAAYGRRRVNQDGYAMVFLPDHPNAQATGWVMEHRKVMADMLGRPLLREEEPHHVNGKRDDNRPENLELWVSSHPSGQRVEDVVEWALVMLGRYAPERLSV